MTTKKKDLKDLVAGDKVVLTKLPTHEYYGYGYRVGTVFTVVKDCNPVHNGVLVKDVLFKGEVANRYISNQFIEPYVEEGKQMFTKKDLKTGMWVEFESGDIGIILEVDSTLFVMDVEKNTCVTKIDYTYTNALTSEYIKEYDIVKAWSPSSNCNRLLSFDEKGRLIFDRHAEEKTRKEVYAHIEVLEDQIKRLKEKLANG